MPTRYAVRGLFFPLPPSTIEVKMYLRDRFAPPLFSCSYKTLFPKPLYSHPYKTGGVTLGISSSQNLVASGTPAVPRSSGKCPAISTLQPLAVSCSLFALSCLLPLFVFSRLRTLFAKIPGGWGGIPSSERSNAPSFQRANNPQLSLRLPQYPAPIAPGISPRHHCRGAPNLSFGHCLSQLPRWK